MAPDDDLDERAKERAPLSAGGETRSEAFRRLKAVPGEIWAFAFYLAASLFMTWPVLVRANDVVHGRAGDNLGQVWIYWWFRNAHAFGAQASFSPLIGFPFGSSTGVRLEPLTYLWERFLLLFMDEVTAWNVEIVLGFFLAGVTMYYLVRYLTRDKRAAFVGGFAYCAGVFHAYTVMYIGGALNAVASMPLYILALVHFTRKPGPRRAVLLALASLLLAGTSIHYAFFMAIFTAAFLVVRYACLWIGGRRRSESAKPAPFNVRTAALALGVLLVALVAALPTFYLYQRGSEAPSAERKTPGPMEIQDESYYYSNAASPGDYLLPNVNNPVFGGLSERMVGPVQPNFNNGIYLGWTVILLALVLLLPRKGQALHGAQERVRPRDMGDRLRARAELWGFAAAAATAFVLSLKPYIKIGSVRIPMPSRLFAIFVPWFRWYSRLAVVLSICLIVLACFGLRRLLRATGARSWLVLAAVVALMALEMLLVPPFNYVSDEDVPPVFDKVAALGDEAAFAFYPLMESGPFVTSRLMFYQRHFARPMLNGAFPSSQGETLRRTVFNPYNKATPAILAAYGLNHMVFFEGEVEGAGGQDPDASLLGEGLVQVDSFSGPGVFGRGKIFEVTAPPAEFVPMYLGDISVPYVDQGGLTVRVVDGEGMIRLENLSGRERVVTVRLPMDNPLSRREVMIRAGGRTLWHEALEAGQAATAEIRDVAVGRDGTELSITVDGDPYTLPEQYVKLFGTRRALLKIGDLEVVADD